MRDVQKPRRQRAEPSRLTIGILGPVEAKAGDRSIPLGGSKARALLSILVLHANEAVSTDRLIEDLWGVDTPPTAPKMLQVLVSRIRRALEPDDVLVTRAPGYVLRAAPDQIDLGRFEAQVDAARRMPPTEPGRAADALREALGLWRGPPLSDVAREPFAVWAIPRLEELRLAVLEERIDLDLRAGRHKDLVGELRDLVARFPFRERFAGQLMVALYRTGRQAEALDVFHRIRAQLAHDLGIEPGTDLQQLQMAVLRQDHILDASSGTEPVTPDAVGRDPVGSQPAGQRSTVVDRSVRARTAIPVRIVGLVVLAVLGGVALVAVPGRLGIASSKVGAGSSVPVAVPDSVAVFDPVSRELVDDVPAGHAPGPVAATDSDLWVGSVDDHTVMQIDLASRRVLHTNGLSAAPTTLVAADGNVWIGNGFSGTLSRILTAYDQLSAPFFPDKAIPGSLAMAAAHGDLWVGPGDQTLLRMDASSLQVKSTVSVPDRVLAIATSDDAAWTIDFRDRLVRRIDRASGMSSTGLPVDGTPTAIAFGAGSVWVATSAPDRIWQIDPVRDVVLASYPVQVTPGALVVGPDDILVLDKAQGVVERLDPAGRALPTTVTLGRPVGGAAFAQGKLWLTIR